MPFIPWSFDLMFIRDIASIFFIVALHHIYRIIKDFLQARKYLTYLVLAF